MSGVRGEPAPANVKVCLNYLGGFRNQMTFVLTGLDIEEKAALVERTLRRALDVNAVRCLRNSTCPHRQARRHTNQEAAALLESDGQEPGREEGRPRILRRGHRNGAGQLPGLFLHDAAE